MAFLEGLKDRAKSLLDNASKAETAPPQMNICMLGARGVGKTSIITSMYYGQQASIEGTDLFLIADSGTDEVLRQKQRTLENIFAVMHDADDLMKDVGLVGDSTESQFDFSYGLQSERVNIHLQIRDYPGEYLLKNPEQVAAYIREANAVLIAIDTVCLMENDGRYNEGKNKPRLVMDFLKEHLPDGEEKLVLFVPLKCEKYVREERLGEVRQRIREVYSELIDCLKDRDNQRKLRNKICCAIVPIETLGGAEFDSFGRNFDGSVEETVLEDGVIIPNMIYYRYVNDVGYAPRNCAQPLLYLLGFFAKQYNQMKEAQHKSGFLARLFDRFRLVPNIERFTLEAGKLRIKRENNGRHDEVLFGLGRI